MEKLTCKCGRKFVPAYRNGILISKLCPNCRYKKALAQSGSKKDNLYSYRKKVSKKGLKRGKIIPHKFEFYRTTAWRYFSRYVLLYYANSDLAVQCATSGQWMSITSKNSQCGHYIKVRDMSKTNYATAFDFRNVAPQSLQDNRYGGGRQDIMRKWLVNRFGEKEIEDLEIKKNTICRLDKSELDYWAEFYKKKFNDLLKERNIKNPWQK